MRRYAEKTGVPVDRSRAEIERTLVRYGADAFRYGWKAGLATIEFAAHGRHIRFSLPLPRRDDHEFTLTPTGRERSEVQAERAWEQACRQRWRALGLAIKAKLEAVECGIAEFEQEFLAYVVDPQTGRTVGEVIRPQLAVSYEAQPAPLLLTHAEPRAG
jgi:hypothetical protein